MSNPKRRMMAGVITAALVGAAADGCWRLARPSAVSAEVACNAALLQGAYGYAGHGNIPSAGRVVSNSHVGRINFDGAGKLTGAESNTNSSETQVFTYTGTYSVQPDCTCTATASVAGVTWNFDFVAMNHGSDILYVIRDGNSALSGTMTQMFRQ